MESAREDAIRREAKRHKGGRGADWLDRDRLETEWGVKQWKPQEGDNFVALIPPEDDNTYFGYCIYVHYDMGPNQESVLCPAEHGKDRCPICEEREALRNDGYEKEDLRPYNCFPPRYLFLIVDVKSRDTAADGIQIWCAPNTINEGLLSLSINERTQEVIIIADMKKGSDFFFHVAGKGKLTRYSGFKLHKRENKIDKALLASIDGMPWLDDFLEFKSYDELVEMLEAVKKSRERQAERGSGDRERGGSQDRGNRDGSSDRERSGWDRGRDGASDRAADSIPYGEKKSDAADGDDASQTAARLKEKVESRRGRSSEQDEPEKKKGGKEKGKKKKDKQKKESDAKGGRKRRARN